MPLGFFFSPLFLVFIILINILIYLDRSGCIHPLIQRCLSEKVCTSLVTKNTRQFGQIIYECNCGKSFCLSCGEDCHSLDIQEHRYLNETWVHCLDHCYCYYHPEKCLHRKHNK